jgi:excisionase family DNA binding protein
MKIPLDKIAGWDYSATKINKVQYSTKMIKEFFTVKEIAKYLKVNPATVYRMLRKGGIPAFKVGSEWRFKKRSIDMWITEGEQQNGNGKEALTPLRFG